MRNEIGLTRRTQEILNNPPPPFEYYDHEDHSMSCRGLIKKYMPDFCWMTAYELLVMFEQANPDIDERTLKVTLSQMVKQGSVTMKNDGHPTNTQLRGPKPKLYMRVR